MLSIEHILIEVVEFANKLKSPCCVNNTSGDSRGLFKVVLVTIKICLVSRFCQTAFNSVEGARKVMLRRFALFIGVLVRSGVQFTVGLFIGCPLGSIIKRNSVSEEEEQRRK
jgi:hypothetical protein